MINAREIAALRDAMRAVHAEGEVPALVTLLQVDGSAYRRPGAKMLVRPDGATTCMISGGCLEPELAEVAREVLASGKPRRVRYDLSEEEVWGLGLGCGGAIDLYIEPLHRQSVPAQWVELQAAGAPAVLASMFTKNGATHRLFRGPAPAGNGGNSGSGEPLSAEPMNDRVAARAAQLLEAGSSASKLESVDGHEVFFDLSTSVPELVLFGGGPGAVPLAARAVEIGFRVIVVDPRTSVANTASFPDAEIVAAHPEQYPELVPVSPHSHVVIMNHHLERDREALVYAIEHTPAYIGVLGPRRRFEKLLDALEAEGRKPDEDAVHRVHNPVGLDIGAEGPEEIALSILAEILAEQRGHSGTRLMDKGSGIHERRSSRVHGRAHSGTAAQGRSAAAAQN